MFQQDALELETRADFRRREAETIFRDLMQEQLHRGLYYARAHVRLGAILGSRLAARFTRLENYSTDVVTSTPPYDAWLITLASLNALGDVLALRPDTDSITLLSVVRKVKRGPAIVYADVLTADSTAAVISLSGFAQRYLTNRRVSRVAVECVAAAIRGTVAQLDTVSVRNGVDAGTTVAGPSLE